MANVRHVVVHIEVATAIRVEQPGALSPHQVNWIPVEKFIGIAQQSLASGNQVFIAIGQQRYLV